MFYPEYPAFPQPVSGAHQKLALHALQTTDLRITTKNIMLVGYRIQYPEWEMLYHFVACLPRSPTNIDMFHSILGARGSVGDWGTVLQPGWSQVQIPMRSLDFLIYLILPAALWPWGRLSL
jgi:hypothetical protein